MGPHTERRGSSREGSLIFRKPGGEIEAKRSRGEASVPIQIRDEEAFMGIEKETAIRLCGKKNRPQEGAWYARKKGGAIGTCSRSSAKNSARHRVSERTRSRRRFLGNQPQRSSAKNEPGRVSFKGKRGQGWDRGGGKEYPVTPHPHQLRGVKKKDGLQVSGRGKSAPWGLREDGAVGPIEKRLKRIRGTEDSS